MKDEDQKIELSGIAIFCIALMPAALLAIYGQIEDDLARKPKLIMAEPVKKNEITPEMLQVGSAMLSKKATDFWILSRRQDIARSVFLSMQEEQERQIAKGR